MRRLWPRRWRRSDVYHRLRRRSTPASGWSTGSTGGPGGPLRERVVQDVEVPLERLPEFLAWFDEHVGMRPVWLCPAGGPARLADLPAGAAARSTSTSASGAPCTSAPTRPTGPTNRAIEEQVHALGGHKSLYSEAFYDRATFDRLYDGEHLARRQGRHDPDDRLTSLYDKAVRRQ